MVVWEQPEGEIRKGVSRWRAVFDQLRERPGEWALVAEDEWVMGVRQGLMKFGCEVTSRGNGTATPGKAEKIYARYVGDSDE